MRSKMPLHSSSTIRHISRAQPMRRPSSMLYPAPAPVAAPASDLTAQLQQLAQLHDSGVLSDEEFAAAKQKLLAG